MKLRIIILLMALVMLSGIEACSPSTQPEQEQSATFDLEKLIIDVFSPQPREKVLVMIDVPDRDIADNEGWADRREMANEWHTVFRQLQDTIDFQVHPLLNYPATGAHNGPLPEIGEMNGKQIRIEDVVADTNIIVALTEYSATAPLVEFTMEFPNLRAASMPMVSRSMEQTALAADYGEVARKAHILANKLDQALGAEVKFSTGHRFYYDLRYREAEADDGNLHADKEGVRVINLPSGEAFIAPYEGELEGQPSRTEGAMPFFCLDDIVLITVEANRVVDVIGEGQCADEVREYISVDEARRNIAELGLGVNERAVITGNVLEDEKVMGMHFAVGRSDHIGGTVGVDDFSDPSNVVHRDVVFPSGGQIEVARLVLQYEDGTSEEIISDGQYARSLFATKDQELAATLNQVMLAWLIIMAASVGILAWDMEFVTLTPLMIKIRWVLIIVIFGPLGLMAYIVTYRRSRRSELLNVDVTR